MSQSSNLSIGVFDSGVGGLSLLRVIRKHLPDARLLYVADSAHAPYGDRRAEFIRQRCETIAAFLVAQRVSAIVVACNTASVLALNHLRQKFEIPFVGIEPAIKPAASFTRSGVVGVLATSRTIESPGVKRLCELYGDNVEILLQACPGLADRIENADLASTETRSLLQQALAPLLDRGADTIVLGCTHYPFVKPVVQQIVGSRVTVIEPGDAVARQLQRRLCELQQRKLAPLQTAVVCSADLDATSGSDADGDATTRASTDVSLVASSKPALAGGDGESLCMAAETFYSTGPVDSVAGVVSQLWGEPVVVRYLQGL